MVGSSGFRRKTEVSTPLLYYRAKRVRKGRRFDDRSGTESVNLPIPLCPLRQVFRHRSGCGDDGCLAGRFYWSFIPYIPLIADFIAG